MWRDQAYLLDILIAARKILSYIADSNFEEFANSDLLQSAIERQFEIMGEAARLISNEMRTQNPQIPWNLMMGLRNQLIHNYRNIDNRTLWDTIHNDLLPLIMQIEPLVPSEDQVD
jgi:uncharacterized protein with HEPN domain